MPIPPFDDSGYLPPGLHRATIDEVARRFGTESELRRVQMESLRWMVDLANQAGISRMVLNGSFVTDIMDPNDVDCVLLLADDYPREPRAADELAAGLPFLELAFVDEPGFDRLVTRFFATDRLGRSKGMVELI